MDDEYYLGFDLSTQQLKCLAINQDLKLIAEETVNFDEDFPQYNTNKGVYVNGTTVDCPVALWLEAIDLLFKRLRDSSFDVSKVKAISGSCQQHGSVYWSHDAWQLLETLDTAKGSLKDQLYPSGFSRSTAPNWQDHSTSVQCKELEGVVGGPIEMANITGSRAHFRFTGPQILKIIEQESETYESTAAITLVSNFATSLLCGKLVPLEEADACGMNLYDIKERKFNEKLIGYMDSKRSLKTGSSVLNKLLGNPIRSGAPTNVGCISQYFVERYGFNQDCSIYPFTGDNLATICYLPLKSNDILLSMGTSTTILLVTDQYHPSPNYHLFIHPTIPDYYMGMICYCNGSLARENVRDRLNLKYQKAQGDWTLFNKAIVDDTINNEDELGIYFPLGEIVPSVSATTRRIKFNVQTGQIKESVDAYEDEGHDVKNIIESQALSCRVRVSPLLAPDATNQTVGKKGPVVKFDFDEVPIGEYLTRRPKRAFFVGGASKNDAIVNQFAQVIGATENNYRSEITNACALGGCYKALWSDLCSNKIIIKSFDKFLNERFPQDELHLICGPNEDKWRFYNNKIIPLSLLEQELS